MLALYAGTLGTSAALLFALQPMVGKMLLPLLGGAPAVWNTCLMFFQTTLLAGYLYAHLVAQRLGPRAQAIVHLGLVGAAALTLPIAVRAAGPPGPRPSLWLLGVLTATAGAPFLALAATAPLLQRWFAAAAHPAARDPFFLYAASNAGSLLALAAYPAVVERHLPSAAQAWWWAWGYGAFVASTALCAWGFVRARPAAPSPPPGAAPAAPGAPPDAAPATGSWPERLGWGALAAVPSSLLLSVTAHATTNIAAAPLLWVVPLGLYLATFVLAFARTPPPRRAVRALAAPAAVAVTLALLGLGPRTAGLALAIHTGAFFVLALACHGELAGRRPGVARLTEFYLWLAIGGAVGGAFNALAAPVLFASLAEYPLGVVAACLVLPSVSAVVARPGDWRRDVAWAAGILAYVVVMQRALPSLDVEAESFMALLVSLGLPLALTTLVWPRARRFGLCLGAVLLAGAWPPSDRLAHAERNFFGQVATTLDPGGRYRQFVHGDTLHGAQALDPARRREPLAYFHPSGPIGQVFADLDARQAVRRVAVVGLGVGTLAAYGRPGQRWTFYEINPAVDRLARDATRFTYLQDSAAAWDVVLGDGRLGLAAARDGEFDVIVLDAFTSDALPVHLLTVEAVDLYLAKLAPGGLLVVDVSNRYLDLAAVLAAVAAARELDGLWWHHRATPAERARHVVDSAWGVVARRPAPLDALRADPRWQPLAPRPEVRPWTDQYSSLVGAWRARPSGAGP